MPKSQLRGVMVVQHDVGYAFVLGVPRNRYRRNWQRMRQIEVHGDDSLRSALQQQAGILLKQLGIMAMNAGHKKIIPVAGAVLNPGNDCRTVPVADFVRNHANGEGPLSAQRLGKEIWPIIQLPRCCNNPFPSGFGDMFGRRRIIQHCRHCARREPHMRGHRLEGDCAPVRVRLFAVLCHAFHRAPTNRFYPNDWVRASHYRAMPVLRKLLSKCSDSMEMKKGELRSASRLEGKGPALDLDLLETRTGSYACL